MKESALVSESAALWVGIVILSVQSVAGTLTLPAVPDVVMDEDTTVMEVPFSVGGVVAPESTLVTSASNRFPTPELSFAFAGGGTNRLLLIYPAPNANGATTVSIRASQPGSSSAETSFRLSIEAVNDPPAFGPIPNQLVAVGSGSLSVPFTANDPDGDTPQFSAYPGNSNLISNTGVRVRVSGAARSVEIQIPGNKTGSTPIYVEAWDKVATNVTSFVLTIREADFISSSQVSLTTMIGMVDVNADGLQDALTKNGFALNSGKGGVTQSAMLPTTSTVERWGDADGDGDLDVLGISQGASNRVFRTDLIAGKLPAFTMLTNRTQPSPVSPIAFWSDLDLDGDLDAVLSSTNNYYVAARVPFNFVGENNGTGQLAFRSGGLPPLGRIIAAADYDEDGDNDLLLDATVSPTTPNRLRLAVWMNDGTAQFLDAGIGFPLASNLVATGGWVDFDGDRQLDIWIQRVTPTGTDLQLLRRAGGAFVEHLRITTAILGGAGAGVAWADFDFDGDLDFFAPAGLAGDPVPRQSLTRLYLQESAGIFRSSLPLRATPWRTSPVTLGVGDWVGDNQCDVVVTGTGEVSLFENRQHLVNALPSAPTQLQSRVSGTWVTLSWGWSADDNQSVPLTYNVRAGTVPGGNDVVPSMAVALGRRLMAAPGNAGYRTWMPLELSRLHTDTVYWSVQAVDNCFVGGPFATEQVLHLAHADNQPPVIGAITSQSMSEGEVLAMPFTVTDDYTFGAEIRVRVTLSNSNAIAATNGLRVTVPPDDNSHGTRRLLTFAPRANFAGAVILTLTATDHAGATTVVPVAVAVKQVLKGPAPSLGISFGGFSIHLTATTDPYSRWWIETSEDLSQWAPLSEPDEAIIADSIGRLSIHLPESPGPQRFYRLVNGDRAVSSPL